MNVIASGHKIDQVVNYQAPVRHREELGRIPSDVFLDTEKTPPLDSLRHDRAISVDQPMVEDGQPVMEARSVHFQESARSPVAAALLGGFIGGVTGFILGGWASILTQQGAFLVAGAGLGAVGVGGLAALGAAGDRVRLVEEDKSIEHRRMTGVHVSVEPGSLHGQSGWFHRFEPDFESTRLGSYTEPRVEHFRS